MNVLTQPAANTDTLQPIKNQRIQTVDILRGFIMVIMALDHVREYFGPTPFRAEDVAQTTVPLFFTRWITHICAPLFLLLSGVSAYLYMQKYSKRKTSKFLLTRGLWLILLEIVVFTFILQWGYPMILLSIIWAIGCSMLLLAAGIWLPRWLNFSVAIAIIVLHNLLPSINPVTASTLLPALLHNTPFVFMIGSLPVLCAYTIFPWAAVMLLGYSLGPSLIKWNKPPSRRWLYVGLVMIALFVAIRATNFYGDPSIWSVQDRGGIYTALSFLNLNKYPASFLFLLVTLGIGAILWYIFSAKFNRLASFLEVYGRVPFFYFLLHFLIISLSSLIWSAISFGKPYNLSFMAVANWPASYQPNLLRVYAVWIIVVLLLYYPCKWYGRFKQHSKAWWVSYL